jgi:hypothetical protein
MFLYDRTIRRRGLGWLSCEQAFLLSACCDAGTGDQQSDQSDHGDAQYSLSTWITPIHQNSISNDIHTLQHVYFLFQLGRLAIDSKNRNMIIS